MHSFISVTRWFSRIFLHASIFILIASFCFVFLIGDKQNVKDTIYESGTYDKYVNSIINTNIEASKGSESVVILEDLEVQKIANSVFNPKYLQQQTEKLIDGVYAWLEGDTSELEFELDFTSKRDLLNLQIANYASNRILELPICEDNYISSLNAFTTECQPQDYDSLVMQAQIKSDLDNSEFLKNPIINENQLPSTADGTRIQEKFSYLPIIFQLLRISIILSSLLFIFASFVYLIARKPYFKGLRSYGKDIFVNSLMIIAITIFFGFVMPQFSSAFSIQGSETSQLINGALEVFARKLNFIIIKVAGSIALIGLCVILIRRLIVPFNQYSSLAKKAGIVSGEAKKTKKSNKKIPPLQSSEGRTKNKSSKKSKKKYKKI